MFRKIIDSIFKLAKKKREIELLPANKLQVVSEKGRANVLKTQNELAEQDIRILKKYIADEVYYIASVRGNNKTTVWFNDITGYSHETNRESIPVIVDWLKFHGYTVSDASSYSACDPYIKIEWSTDADTSN